jgi:hypothetical protein
VEIRRGRERRREKRKRKKEEEEEERRRRRRRRRRRNRNIFRSISQGWKRNEIMSHSNHRLKLKY